ncbi:MAG: bifunctional isocitrate dehydrogenase kinase/phosphatase [Rhodocyclaceae bacterium]
MNWASDIPATQNPTAQGIAAAMLDGFNKHYRLFHEATIVAKEHFEAAEWQAQQKAVRDRIQFYDARVKETVERLNHEFNASSLDETTWRQTKLYYIGLLTNHRQPELAETFFNSVFCRIMHRTYFNNDFIFVRPAVSTEYMDSDPPSYRVYYPLRDGLRAALREMFLDFGWQCPFANLDRDIQYMVRAIRNHMGEWPKAEPNLQLRVLASAFYRNKGAYIIGKAVNGDQDYPFAVPVLHDPNGRLYLDTVLLEFPRIVTLFSLNRAYFMVDMEVPSAYVEFLAGIMPGKPKTEIYTMLGLQKQGKNIFYRDLIHHLRHSQDDFVVAPGIPGLVMLVFTLPSFPYVFKVIKDEFGASKESDRATVKSKYLLVKQVDRVGRMADTLEFSDVALPKARFNPALLDDLRRKVQSQLEEEDNTVVIRHVSIERRLEPLNMFLDKAADDEIDHAVCEYGNAIRELAAANIFPGDLLWKNFGVTRFGRVVFYDYDEIEYLTDCNFRRIPPAANPEDEMSGEVWYSVARNDIFPEEFGAFLLGSPRIRQAFMRYHADLLQPDFWQETQKKIRAAHVVDFFPYPETVRFCHVFGGSRAEKPPGERTGDEEKSYSVEIT